MIAEKKKKTYGEIRHEGFMAFWHKISIGQNPYQIPGSKNYSCAEIVWQEGWHDARLEKLAEDRM